MADVEVDSSQSGSPPPAKRPRVAISEQPKTEGKTFFDKQLDAIKINVSRYMREEHVKISKCVDWY